jgi:2-oxoglutarate ferredoxin oxidoreductase subunit alpha
MEKVRLIQGNEACVEGALAAGCTFFAGYPITPSSEIAELMAFHLPRHDGVFIQMEDEIGSIAAIIGASIAGKKAMTATSGPGFSLMQENLGFAAMAEIPIVIVNVQRGGPSTGRPTAPAQGDVMQTRWGTHGDHPIVVYSPTSVQETFELTVQSFNVAEMLRTPVILLSDEVIAHMRERFQYPENVTVIDRKRPKKDEKEYLPYKDDGSGIPPMADFGTGYRYHITGLIHDESGYPSEDPEIQRKLLERLMGKTERYKDEITLIDEYFTDDMNVVVVSYGCSFRSAIHAVKTLRKEGIKAGCIKLKSLWPFPKETITKISEGVKGIVVPELNFEQIASEIRKYVDVPVKGVNRYDGSVIRPFEIEKTVRGLL